jgi:hypothetical protein
LRTRTRIPNSNLAVSGHHNGWRRSREWRVEDKECAYHFDVMEENLREGPADEDEE